MCAEHARDRYGFLLDSAPLMNSIGKLAFITTTFIDNNNIMIVNETSFVFVCSFDTYIGLIIELMFTQNV